MIDIGLDVLESLQPEAMDVYEIKRRYGRDLRLWGGLGTQRLLPFGTTDEIRAEVERLRRLLGRGGGYILAPAKPLLPEVPTGNAVAAIEAFTQPPHKSPEMPSKSRYCWPPSSMVEYR